MVKQNGIYLNCSLESGVIFRVLSLSDAADCELQPELNCQAAQAYRRAGYGMGEPLHETKPDEVHSCADKKDYPDHGYNSRSSKHNGYYYYAGPTACSCGIHQHGNQNLTRPKNKNYK